MNLAFRILWTLLCFELGLLLIILPWIEVWERNFFLSSYPEWRPFLTSTFTRGAVSGLGLLDCFVAFTLLFPKKKKSEPGE